MTTQILRICAIGLLSHLVLAQSWDALNDEGNSLRARGLCRQAVSVLQRAQTAAINAPANPSALAISTNNLAATYLCLREFTQAERHFREALKLLENDRSTELRAGILINLGVLMIHLSREKEAESLLRQSLASAESVGRGTTTASALASLGVLHMQLGGYREARELFLRSLEIWQAANPNGVEAATTLNNLGAVSLYLHEFSEAKDTIARALEIRRRLLPKAHPDIAQSLYNYGVALDKLRERKPAREAFSEAASMRAAFDSTNLIGVTVDVKLLNKRRKNERR